MSRATLLNKLVLARAFWRTRRRSKRLATRAAIAAYQAKRLQKLLRHAGKVPAFAAIALRDLAAYPHMDKADLMGNFGAYNIAGIDVDAAWRAYETGAPIRGYSVGASTGTSGNKGLYIISERERFEWLGTILAKAIPDVLSTPHRVAILLPTDSRLYDAANESGRLSLKFFSLTQGIAAHRAALEAFAPTTIVAPPAALLWLAQQHANLSPMHVFSGGEVLDPMDAVMIGAYFNTTIRQIYMATEGLFAVACPHGTLHLAEDCVHFELEPVGDTGLVSPIITDFTRRTQVMVRYRMNDLLRLSKSPCPCGSAYQAVDTVVGRQGDAFVFDGGVMVTPDVIRNAILGASPDIQDFRVRQVTSSQVELYLPAANARHADAARTALTNLFSAHGAAPVMAIHATGLPKDTDAKLRRVIRCQP